MRASTRAIVNTLAQHIRSIFNICLSLYSTKLILMALGETDYGIYALISGVVIMLGFITNAMVVTTQRHLSFYHGKGDFDYLHKVFSTSLFLHILIGVVVCGVLFLAKPYLFNGTLRIDIERINVAILTYYLSLLNLFISFVTAPYRALFYARENIVYISIVDMLDGVLKLLFAIWLLYIQADKLIAYSWMMTAITAFNLLAFAIYATHKFSEARLTFAKEDFSGRLVREMTGFASWTIYSTGCIIGRTQGVAVLLNRAFGTVINSAYGIAMQVSGAIQFVASAVLNAMSPQVVKAEGEQNRQRMLELAEATSKYSFLLLSIVIIPLIFEMSRLLELWLGDVPQHCVMFCNFILVSTACDQLTIGLGIANQAIGKIRNYSLVINSIKLFTLPVAWILLSQGFHVVYVMWGYLIIEIICSLARIPFLKYTAGLSIRHFLSHVYGRIVLPTLIGIAVCWIITTVWQGGLRFLVTIPISILVESVFVWGVSLERNEREAAMIIFKRGHE